MRATLPFVKEKYTLFNREIFEGTLPEIPLRISRSTRTLGTLRYKVLRTGGIKRMSDFSIWISSCFDLSEREIEDTIIHEMIHLYICWNNLEDTSSHGRIFRTMMNTINLRHRRAITISHRGARESETSVKRHYICLSTFMNGDRAITLCATTRIFEFHRQLSRMAGREINTWQWYYSTDSYFNRYPRSRTLKFYRLNDEALTRLSSARKCLCDGKTFRPDL